MARPDKIEKTDADWRQSLTPEQYRITRKHGTERAFTGPFQHVKADGTFQCVCCGAPLFRTDAKYESGSGWPSFYAPISRQVVDEHKDRSMLMTRTEVRCAACDAHLGHVFSDGPAPTGLRYCMNGNALAFAEDAG